MSDEKQDPFEIQVKRVARIAELEAQAAAMREALESCGWVVADPDSSYNDSVCAWCNVYWHDAKPKPDHAPDCRVAKALASDAGAALLERLRTAEENLRLAENQIDGLNNSMRVLHAAAIEEAAKVAELESAAYQANAMECDAAGQTTSGTNDIHGALACRRVAAAIRALAAKEPKP